MSQRKAARFAGAMYLSVILFYIFSDRIISGIEGNGNFLEIVHRIVLSQQQYRFGLYLLLGEQLFTLALALALYVTVKPISKNLAMAALLFRTVEVIIGVVMVILLFFVLQLHLEANHTSGFNVEQLQTWVNLTQKETEVGTNMAATFFSFGSTIFFFLFLKSNYISKFLSLLGLLSSLLIVVVCVIKLIFPRYESMADYGWIPMTIAEVFTGLWLLIKSVKSSNT